MIHTSAMVVRKTLTSAHLTFLVCGPGSIFERDAGGGAEEKDHKVKQKKADTCVSILQWKP